MSTELEALHVRVAQLERALAIQSRSPRRRPALIALAVVVVGVAIPMWAGRALAGTCSNILPASMVTLCADEPALAGELNGNFAQVLSFISQKVGPVGSADVTVTGTLTAPRASINGPIYRGSTLPSTQDLGLYSQVAGNYLRLVTNGGNIELYSDGSAANGWAGVTPSMSVLPNGNAVVRGDVSVNTNV
jgi:hypothetical protein